MKPEQFYTLYGVEGSYYAAKTRSYLRIKQIPFKEVLADRRTFDEEIIPRVGHPVVPVLVTPFDETVQDTSIIFDILEDRHPEPAVTPSSPSAKIAAYLIEILADEWLKLPALHYRWYYDHEFATIMMGENNDPNAPAEIQRIVGKKIAARFRSWPKHLGATELTKNGVENHFLEFLDYLEEHFFQHEFVLGSRVTMADCALMGPMYAHLYRDPYSGKILHWRAPRVCRWIETMLTSPKTSLNTPIPDIVPSTMIKVLAHLNKDFVPTFVDALELIQVWLEKSTLSRVPRYVGSHSFTIGRQKLYQATGRRSLHPFEQWKIQRLQKAIAEAETQSPSEAQSFLSKVGASPLKKININKRLCLTNFHLSREC